MFALVFWIEEQQFSVVEAKDIVLDKSNDNLKEGMTCPVKWRERRGRKVEEYLYDAEIKSISGEWTISFNFSRHTAEEVQKVGQELAHRQNFWNFPLKVSSFKLCRMIAFEGQ